MSVIPVTLGDPVTLSLVLEDGYIGAFPLVRIYESGSSTPIDTVALTHRALGRYDAEYTPPALGMYFALFVVYADAAHTVENIRYTREEEQILVRSSNIDQVSDMLLRVLGLLYENSILDRLAHDNCNQLTSARLRIFDSASNVPSVPDGDETTGLIATYVITASWAGPGREEMYRMEKA